VLDPTERATLPLGMGYYSRRRTTWGRNRNIELVVTAVVVGIVAVVLVVFLVVYHDFPLRVS
jgi:heme/copper-type cytochrome/quinol oxidase subunit 2